MNLGLPWEDQKSPIFMKNEVVDLTCCSSVANLGALGAILWICRFPTLILNAFWCFLNQISIDSLVIFDRFGLEFLYISGAGLAFDSEDSLTAPTT